MTKNGPSTPGASAGEYVLGVNAAELNRLGLQHRLWSDAAHALWLRAGIQPGARVLDVGSGPGFAALDLAQIVGADSPPLAGRSIEPGQVVAVDESSAFLEYLNTQCRARGVGNVLTLQGNAVALGDIAGLRHVQFDAAYARWVLCFVSDVQAVIKGVLNLLKPGGRFVVQDYFNYEACTIAPRRESFSRVIRATADSWRARGGDPDVMGRLPGMLERSGFRVEHIAANQRLARPGEPMWHWPHTFWTYFSHVLVQTGHLDTQEQQAWARDWEDASRTPGAFITLPAVYDLIAVKT